MKTDPIIGRMYRHYKRGLYVVEAIADHTERHLERLVIYRHVSGKVYARPVENFIEDVTWGKPMGDIDGSVEPVQVTEPRFTLLPVGFKL